jgi:hypothetical protein
MHNECPGPSSANMGLGEKEAQEVMNHSLGGRPRPGPGHVVGEEGPCSYGLCVSGLSPQVHSSSKSPKDSPKLGRGQSSRRKAVLSETELKYSGSRKR